MDQLSAVAMDSPEPSLSPQLTARMREILNNTGQFNEKTINGFSMYTAKKVGVPQSNQLKCITWNQNSGHIAAGAAEGHLRVIKLAPEFDKVIGANMLSANQALEGHHDDVVCASWNESKQKLTTSDASGLIIVWGSHNSMWFEEMINNRNKSRVVGMGWNPDGNRVAIAYEDGNAIVGTVDGNRIWSKDLPITLSACEWTADGSSLLFGTAEGEVHIYDSQGNMQDRMAMPALESVDLERALDQDYKKEHIICIQWWYPVLKSTEESQSTSQILDAYTNDDKRNNIDKHGSGDRNVLFVAFSSGSIQFMKSERDKDPKVMRIPNFTLTSARWSPNGAFVAITGYEVMDVHKTSAMVYLASSLGELLNYQSVGEGVSLNSVTWDPSGLRLALAVDQHIYFVNLRPHYKWGYCKNTVVYVYEKEERNQFNLVFFDTKMEEKYLRVISNFEHLCTCEDYCLVVTRSNDPASGKFMATLCSNIGNSIDFKGFDVLPDCVAINKSCAVIAGGDMYFIWRFVVPQNNTFNVVPVAKDDIIMSIDGEIDPKRKIKKPSDDIKAITIADTYFLAICSTGALYKIALNDGSIIKKYQCIPGVHSIEMNCNFTKFAVADNSCNLTIFDLKENEITKRGPERADAWSFKWDSEKPDTIAFTDKSRMVVLQGKTAEEPMRSSGYICSFKDLTVKTVLVDSFLQDPENPSKKFVQDIESKSLRDAKSLLERFNITEAIAYIENNPHTRLWKQLVTVALERADYKTAEAAYVKLSDYAGIHFCKRVAKIQDEQIRKGEIMAYIGKFELAEKAFMQRDRRFAIPV